MPEEEGIRPGFRGCVMFKGWFGKASWNMLTHLNRIIRMSG